MTLTTGDLNRATLARQLLLRREPLEVPEAVRRVVALQAQHAASPYVALWNRLDGFRPESLDAAFTGRTVVKATLMRVTLHAVHAEDRPVFRRALEPTLYASRLGARFAAAGLTPADAGELLPHLLRYAEQPRTAGELEAWLGQRLGGERKKGAWWGMKGYAPLLHAVTGAPWSFGDPASYVAAQPEPGPMGKEPDQEALRTLLLRHLAGFGPASVADMARFALVGRSFVRQALRSLDGAVEELRGPGGTVLFDLPGAPRPPADTPAPPRLMAMWDSVLLAHADRSRVIPPAYRPHVIRVNGDVLPTLLVDGRVAGVWRTADGGAVEMKAFHALPAAAWEALEAEARSLLDLLAAREARVYGRYDHWWAKLPPAAQVRRVPPRPA
nr:winged helix DNA-binding domain-containing protein [Streptomyces sp. Xyl84]